jgi:hypothetical protein
MKRKGLLNMNLNRLLAALAALALVAAGCGRYEGGDHQTDRRARTLSAPGDFSVDRARERYSALRGSGASPSTLSARDRKQASRTTRGKPFSVYPVAQRPGYDFYVLETSDELCTYEAAEGSGAAGGCGPPDGFAEGGLSYTIGGPPYRVTAFLPDGSSDVTLTHADGSTSQLGVRRNHGTRVFDELPKRATYTLPDGTEKSMPLSGPPEESVPGEAKRSP